MTRTDPGLGERDVSVVIRVKDSAALLERAVSSVRRTAPLAEVVVVDNMSRDGTHEVAQRVADVVVRRGGALGGMRGPGVEAATRTVVFFMDADQVMQRATISAAVMALRPVEAVVVPERPLRRTGLLNHVIAAERTWAEASGAGIPRVFWRDVYLSYAPPDGVLFGEDRIIGEQVASVAVSTVPILHDEPPTLRALLTKYARYGRAHEGASGTVTPPLAAACAYGRGMSALPLPAALLVPAVAVLKAAKLAAFRWGARRPGSAVPRR